jgi:hypothetical protein
MGGNRRIAAGRIFQKRRSTFKLSHGRSVPLALAKGWASSSLELSVGKRHGKQISTVRASGPTARPAHASAQLIDADLDTASPSLFFFGRCDPADPLVSRQWCDFAPEALGSDIGFDGTSEICWQLMDRAAGDFFSSHTPNRACFA